MKHTIYTLMGIFATLTYLTFLQAATLTCDAIEVTAIALNVRTGASSNHTKVGEIEAGERYTVTNINGNWKEIWYDNSKRWIFAQKYTQAIDVDCITVTAFTLNVRTGASAAYRQVGFMVKDSQWIPLERNGKWQKIWYKSEERWINSDFINSKTSPVGLTSLRINQDASTTTSRFVTMSVTVSENAKYYQISENADFQNASWQTFTGAIKYTLSAQAGTKRIYFRVKNEEGRLSNTLSDTIILDLSAEDKHYSIDKALFYKQYRSKFGTLTQTKVNGLNFLMHKIEQDKEPSLHNASLWKQEVAYMLATIKHEVADRYQPITEFSNTTCRRYDGGCSYKGRGYVQLTHQYNYQKLSSVVGVDLVANPLKALDADISYRVTSYGMHHGIFTGRGLNKYINENLTDYVNARRIVNGKDKASLIAGYARRFESILRSSVR